MIKRILATLALILISAPAFAQDSRCQQHHGGGQSGWFGCGSYSQSQQFVVGGNQQVTNGGVVYGGQQAIFHNAPSTIQVVGSTNPPICRTVERTFWERIAGGAGEGVIDAITGAALGAAGDRIGGTGGKWTRTGAAAGFGIGFNQGSAQRFITVCWQPPQPGTATAGLGTTHSQGAVTRYSCNPRVGGEAFVLQVGPGVFCPTLESAMKIAALTGQPIQPLQGGVSIAGQGFETPDSPQLFQNIINLMARTIGGTPPSAQQPPQAGNPNAPLWGWSHPQATANNKMTCFATRPVANKPAQCSDITVEPATPSETETDWSARMSRKAGFQNFTVSGVKAN